MSLGLICKKIGMAQIFSENGNAVPVTVLSAGPCLVVEKKSAEKHGYNALKLGFENITDDRLNKPQKEYFAKIGLSPKRVIREFRVVSTEGFDVGKEISAEIFKVGEKVSVTGMSKGKGFQGVVKRYKFKGGKASRGSMFHREPGAIGASSFPSRVWKNLRLPGRMGYDRVTLKNIEVVGIDLQKNVICVKGGIPGNRNGIIIVKKQ